MQMLSDYAKTMLELHAKLKDAKIPQEMEIIKHAIEALDAKIDKVVYQIYGLTNEEVDQLK